MAPTAEVHTAGRTAAKALSWRIIATCTTILIGLFMTGSLALGMKIGLPDFVLKYGAFVVHERVWLKASLQALENRLLWKMASWKLTAMTMTVLIVGLVQGGDFTLAVKLGPMDMLIKTFTFYAHEKLWENISYGRSFADPEPDGSASALKQK